MKDILGANGDFLLDLIRSTDIEAKKKKVTFSFCDLTLFLRLSQFTLKSPHTSPVVCISCWGKAGWVEAIGVSAWKMAKGGTGMLVTLE